MPSKAKTCPSTNSYTNGMHNELESLTEVRRILFGDVVDEMQRQIAALGKSLERLQTKHDESLKAHAKTLRALERSTSKLEQAFSSCNEAIEATRNEASALVKQGGKDLKESARSLELKLEKSRAELEQLVSLQKAEVQSQLTDELARMQARKLEKDDLSSVLANIATMIGDEKSS